MERAKLASSTPVRGTFSGSSSHQGSRQGSRAGSPTRSPAKGTALGLGGMTQSGPGSPAPSTPKILTRPSGVPPAGRHNRVPSVTMSPKRGGGGGGDEGGGGWRRDISNAAGSSSSNNNNNNNSNSNANTTSATASPAGGSGTGTLGGLERRASTVRPSFSFANAAGGIRKGSGASTPPTKPSSGVKEESVAAES
jgi:hypothetical protein